VSDELPLIEELTPTPDPADWFRRLAARPYPIFFDSALRHSTLGRYSYLAVDPFEFIRLPVEGNDALAVLSQKLRPFTHLVRQPGLPPFQGGAAGMIAYDLNRQLERIAPPQIDEFGLPALAVGLYDVVIAWDHRTNQAWIISHGYPELEPSARRRRARERLNEVRNWLSAPPQLPSRQHDNPIGFDSLASQFAVPQGPAGLTSNMSAESYLTAITRVIEYIRAGDIFQVNLAQRLLYPAQDDPIFLYLRLRARNPATFAAYFDLGDVQLCSASPERFVRVADGVVETRPIKGTRRRITMPEADLYVGDELRQSEKDRAENVMIVDLLRNDLSRVCEPKSVQVTQLCQLETYQYVQHLVSAVEGRLRNGLGALDLLRASFPGGSITGAPKVRAMEIIAELEPTARGAYCGSLFWHGFDGSLDSSILIRTITAGRGWWQAPVGGGIVAQSEPGREYEETWHKAEGLLRALR
jgi:para-aminobenzoate synthetase component 1